ncbi:hypothetical protein ACFO26_05375 [Lactococcus nasutitermitis]|uniref:DUF3592 domain-containing protein n=1 Tax=Lactococcus nasutitermitis TaxID=1652957 RepID=A0ABV9JCC2_9LACT|nr:hypothetical protein [Lactococcus nasutitermitis]
MKKTVTIFQQILRIIMLIVALAMLGSAIFLTGVHMANKNLEKTPVQAKIVYGDDLRSFHEARYTFDGKKHQVRPLDAYFHKLGNEGETITVYVANKYPERVFITPKGNELIQTAAFMGGWSLLLLIILLGERQLLNRMKRIEEE